MQPLCGDTYCSELPHHTLQGTSGSLRSSQNKIDDDELEQEYDESIQDARATAQKYNITQDVIDAEIRAVRDGK